MGQWSQLPQEKSTPRRVPPYDEFDPTTIFIFVSLWTPCNYGCQRCHDLQSAVFCRPTYSLIPNPFHRPFCNKNCCYTRACSFWASVCTKPLSAGASPQTRAVYPKGGSESNLPHFWKWGGVDGLVILGFDRLLLVVALGIPVMPIVNRDYLKLVLGLLYVYVNSTYSSALWRFWQPVTVHDPSVTGPIRCICKASKVIQRNVTCIFIH